MLLVFACGQFGFILFHSFIFLGFVLSCCGRLLLLLLFFGFSISFYTKQKRIVISKNEIHG